jgi:hypothetical protein
LQPRLPRARIPSAECAKGKGHRVYPNYEGTFSYMRQKTEKETTKC